MKSKPTPPCRLQVLLARRAPIGVIFRRGPSKWVQVIKWDTQRDVFEEGQWFHGHIYVGRSDLSPDGSLLIYFASKFNEKTLSDKEYTYAWTAVSKPPFLTALALWPKGDCWHGGGLFITSRDVFLNHRPDVAEPHPKHLPQGIRVTSNPNAAGEDDGVLVSRMERDGWKILRDLEFDYYSRRTIHPAVFEKHSGKASMNLHVEKYFDDLEEQWLCSIATKEGKSFLIGTGTWADFDQQNRLTFASNGKLFAASLKNGTVSLEELADFNGAKRNALKAPAWAAKW
jgi:hypothetical protein